MDSSYILSPVTPDEFFAEYWEIAPLHIERTDAGYFSHLISVNDIDLLLSCGGQTFPEMHMADANREIGVSEYCNTDQRIDAAAVRKLFLDGSSIVLNRGQLKIPAIADLCRAVSCQMVMRSQANVYLSPASQRGFNPHFDTHDVFVLQVSGSKTFRFYRSDIELPYTDDTFDPALIDSSALQQQTVLNAGDTLYIPRGIVHDAVASGDAPSLHITLGVFPMMQRDLVQEIVQVAGERNVALRRAFLSDKNFEAREVMSLLEELVDDDICQIAKSRLVDNIALSGTATANCTLTTGSVNLDSTVRFDEANLINIEEYRGHLKIRLCGQILEFESPLAEAVKLIVHHKTLRVSDIEGLDNEQQIALCVQLQASGLLAIENRSDDS